MAVIEISGLRKEYVRLRKGRTVAVDGLDLEVPEGGVYGFLGPNGAGKTTTIRCLLGLIRPSAGACKVLGADTRTQLPSVIGRIGSLVEAPALFPGFSGRKNLELLGGLNGYGPKACNMALERVGLASRADDLVKTFSLGMKQRLGVAAALLKDPALLILDEPANGLDPAGIKEIRELMRALAAEGRTIFVSSHILSEVQHVADRVAILARGRCITEGAVNDVLNASRGEGVVVKLADLEAGVAVLSAAGFEASIAEGAIRVMLGGGDPARITEALARKKLYVSELRPDTVDLETVFLQLTEVGADVIGETRQVPS